MLTRSVLTCLIALTFAGASALRAEEVIWRAARKDSAVLPASHTLPTTTNAEPPVRLGRPLLEPASAVMGEGRGGGEPIFRAQGPEMTPLTPGPPPPPPPPIPGVSPLPGGPLPGAEAYNCGIANTPPPSGGFFSQVWDHTRHCWENVTGGVGGIFQPAAGRARFQSDHAFDVFASPVTNPSYSMDPRSLTEIRPVFMWQRTPTNNPIFAGGDNFFLDFVGSVALTEKWSLTLNRIGVVWTEVQAPNPNLSSHVGLSELQLGVKWTPIRNDCTNTVGAFGLVFEIPLGNNDVAQSTGSLSLRPYFSIAQNFLRSDYGSFNVINTVGYDFATDGARTDFFFNCFHLDYEIAKKIYPFVELNYAYYTRDGNVRPFPFEGFDRFNFGSTNVAGHSDLNIALGVRFKVSECWQIGLAGQTDLLTGADHMDRFRLTIDMIFRY